MQKPGYVRLVKELYLKAPNTSHSCVLLFNVLYHCRIILSYLHTDHSLRYRAYWTDWILCLP